MNFQQNIVIHDLAYIGNSKERFHTGGSVGDDRDRSGGSDRGYRGIAQRRLSFFIIDGTFEIRERTALFGQIM